MKTRIRRFAVALLAIALCAPTFFSPSAQAKEPAEKKVHKTGPPLTAPKLVQDMKEAIAFIAMHAKAELNPKSKVEKPFWSGLKNADQQVRIIEAGLKAKNADFLKGLDGLGKSLAELDTAWAVLKKEEKHAQSEISTGITNLNQAQHLLEKHYGGSAVRLKKGGELTAKEKAQAAEALAEQEKLLAKLTALHSKVKAKSIQSRMTADVIHKAAHLGKIEVVDVKSYVHLMEQLRQLDDLIYAYDQCLIVWEPEYYQAWKVVTSDISVIEEIYYEEHWAEYEEWSETEVAFEDYGSYYDHDVSVSSEEVSQYEEFAESYHEEEATEELADEEEELDEAMDDGDDDEESMADEGGDDEDEGDE